ncbi:MULTISPECIES: flagellar biosynthesis regulator FlaF [unclassified Mesorhizobium]|uniref:flagellar biosynthesis regulator FlaF n=1 Tax=unclassified Mesorhizobium TaxID=325217 RepID=UPI000FD3C18E|nr:MULTISPECIES: flagellar biosynthesis regulator FlaF [unclassified Mesorhizobium]RVD51769.1 flagellar biosynthesis regulator FlaF [Mesorhizobium sp. M8A.F.Ca.ET.023.02.2.1]TGR48765.1 flagellar biosynthesis regulator FlaF [bacterium M00.F.Ca.ET.199.01.1.1]TGU37806.1 flagellar biosynthesis regulator FlaF [bacterium M00.F.Ca.ET.156.01.1.1]TGU96808.1 flagellar biosynthesis regulator FlaF [Mesorhizobium sp. M00.F.Ca.ET.151.01.1.1]TGV57929.1 flagellar biosynthesis regulator FlaF [bacterium M00.F.C
MYQFSYADVQSTSVTDAKDRERELLTRSIDMLSAAAAAGRDSMEAVEALNFTNRIWTVFVEDLGSSDNALPKELRANLISIGLWLLREAEDIRQGRTDNFEGLIEVSQIIRDGIQ